MRSGAVQYVATTTIPAAPGGQGGGSGPSIFRLKHGVSYAAFLKAAQKLAKAPNSPTPLNRYGSLLTTMEVAKGQIARDQTVLTPGRYLLVDAGESNNPAKWNKSRFTIRKAAHPAKLPTPAATIHMQDYSYSGSTSVPHDGLLRIVGGGRQDHMAIAIQPGPRHTAEEIANLLKTGQDDAAQKAAGAFASLSDPVSPGAVNQIQLKLTPGPWVLACFMANAKGVEHTKLGMESILTVT
jgi:hypothetical protein